MSSNDPKKEMEASLVHNSLLKLNDMNLVHYVCNTSGRNEELSCSKNQVRRKFKFNSRENKVDSKELEKQKHILKNLIVESLPNSCRQKKPFFIDGLLNEITLLKNLHFSTVKESVNQNHNPDINIEKIKKLENLIKEKEKIENDLKIEVQNLKKDKYKIKEDNEYLARKLHDIEDRDQETLKYMTTKSNLFSKKYEEQKIENEELKKEFYQYKIHKENEKRNDYEDKKKLEKELNKQKEEMGEKIYQLDLQNNEYKNEIVKLQTELTKAKEIALKAQLLSTKYKDQLEAVTKKNLSK